MRFGEFTTGSLQRACLFQKMLQRFNHPVTGPALGDVAPGVPDRILDFLDGVAGGGGPVGEAAVEHGDVVVMIAGAERFLGGDAGEPAEFPQSGPF